MEQSKTLPKFKIRPTNREDKDDVRKAKLLQKLINFQFKHNTNGITDKYLLLQKKLAKMYADEVIFGVKVRWDEMEKTIKTLVGTDYLEDKK